MQNPIPQLKVFNISFSEILLFFIHLKILLILIFDRSMLMDNLFDTDLIKFSNKPPPVICAAACIRFFSVSFKISLV